MTPLSSYLLIQGRCQTPCNSLVYHSCPTNVFTPIHKSITDQLDSPRLSFALTRNYLNTQPFLYLRDRSQMTSAQAWPKVIPPRPLSSSVIFPYPPPPFPPPPVEDNQNVDRSHTGCIIIYIDRYMVLILILNKIKTIVYIMLNNSTILKIYLNVKSFINNFRQSK